MDTNEGKPADTRSEGKIATLHDKVRPYARSLIEKAAAENIIVKIISGTRSYEEQEELYRKFKAGGPIAAPPGKSNHNFGLAFDIGIFEGDLDPEKAKTYIPESPDYKTVGAIGVALGLEWGGNWKRQDEPHFQLRPDWAAGLPEPAMLAKLADRKSNNVDAFA